METISQLPAAVSVSTSDLLAATQGSTGPGTGTTNKLTIAQLLTLVPNSRPYGRMLLQWTGGATVANGTYWFVANTPYAGTITSLDFLTGNGSFTADVQIGGVSVTGLSAVAVSSATLSNAAATAANTFSAGAIITVIVTSAVSAPTNALLELNVTWA